MPYLTISRSSKYEKLYRHITLSIDGKFYGPIKKGAKLEIHLAPGNYQVQSHLDWCTSNVLDVVIHQDSDIVLQVNPGNGPILYRAFFKSNRYLRLDKIAG